MFVFVVSFQFLQDIFSGSTHLSDSSTLILERVDRHHAGVYQCAADNGVREPVSMDINLTILCEFCSMTVDKFPLNCRIPIGLLFVCSIFFSLSLSLAIFHLFLHFVFSFSRYIWLVVVLSMLILFFCSVHSFVLLLVPVSILSFVNGVFCVVCLLLFLFFFAAESVRRAHSIWMSFQSRAHGIVGIYRESKI